MEGQRLCQKCGEPQGRSTYKLLCQKCIKSLPQCYSCGIVCGAKEWGYHMEEEAIPCILKKNGKKIALCGGCKGQLLRRKYLVLDRNVKILAEEIEIISAGPNQ